MGKKAYSYREGHLPPDFNPLTRNPNPHFAGRRFLDRNDIGNAPFLFQIVTFCFMFRRSLAPTSEIDSAAKPSELGISIGGGAGGRNASKRGRFRGLLPIRRRRVGVSGDGGELPGVIWGL